MRTFQRIDETFFKAYLSVSLCIYFEKRKRRLLEKSQTLWITNK